MGNCCPNTTTLVAEHETSLKTTNDDAPTSKVTSNEHESTATSNQHSTTIGDENATDPPSVQPQNKKESSQTSQPVETQAPEQKEPPAPSKIKRDTFWRVYVTPAERVGIPSFARLFEINRVLTERFGSIKTTNHSTQGGEVGESGASGGTSTEDIKHSYKEKIKDLVGVLEKKENQDVAFDILSKLMTTSLKQYMNDYYNERKHTNVIEMIFNQIILSKFNDEYQRVINNNNYNSNMIDVITDNGNDNYNGNNVHQNMVFNIAGIMYLIFNFLSDFKWRSTTKNDLIHCSMVNSHWFRYCNNPNSIYFVEIGNFIKQSFNNIDSNNGNNIYTRAWQKYCHGKKVAIHAPSMIKNRRYNIVDSALNFRHKMNLILGRLIRFENVKYIYGMLKNVESELEILKAILQNSKEKVEIYGLYMSQDRLGGLLRPLELCNVKDVTLVNSFCWMKWTNKCRKLTISLSAWEDGKSEWCDYILGNCDLTENCIKYFLVFLFFVFVFPFIFCSIFGLKQLCICAYAKKKGVEWLVLRSIPQQSALIKSFINKIAPKFTNLKYLSLFLIVPNATNPDILLFWKLLKPIIMNNGTLVKGFIHTSNDCETFHNLCQMINENSLPIHKFELDVDFYAVKDNKIEYIKQIIGNKNLKCLSFKNGDEGASELESLIKQINDTTQNTDFKSLKMIEFSKPRVHSPSTHVTLKGINECLSMKIIKQHQLFVDAHFRVFYDVDPQFQSNIINDENNVSHAYEESFDLLCKNVLSLLINERIPINITVRFEKSYKSKSEIIFDVGKYYNDIFLKYFDEKNILDKYKKPNKNELCNCWENPVIMFESTQRIINEEEIKMILFHVANAENKFQFYGGESSSFSIEFD